MIKGFRELTRRTFLRTAGAASAGAIVSGCTEPADPYALKKPPVPGSQGWAAGEQRWVTSTCDQCFAGCGIRVRVVEGRAVKIEGNPSCPLNGGGLGPKGQAGLHMLYHPDRLRRPLQRVGQRGSGKWKPVSWEKAIGEIARQLRELREQGKPEGLVLIDGGPRGIMTELWRRFLAAFGSPNYVDHKSATDGGIPLAMTFMQGAADLPAYDLQNCHYILVFGENLLESACQTIFMIRSATAVQRLGINHRAKFVQLSPGFSVSAAKADEWIRVQPGTYGAIALGIAHVLIKDGLYDAEFVKAQCFGFEDWSQGEVKHRGFRDVVLNDYPTEKVARIAGIAPATIVRLAHELADHRPAVAIADPAATLTTNGLGTAMAIHALNALLGSLERPGGVLVQRRAPLKPWPAVEQDKVAQAGTSAPRLDGAGTPVCPLANSFLLGLPDAIVAGKPYQAQALFLYRSNPIFSKPEAKRWIEAISRVPLVVSFSPLPDESTRWADFVLPDHTYLERWEIVEPVPSTGYAMLGLRQPAVVPVHETRATGDVIIGLAQEIGGGVGRAFPWPDYRAAQLERLEGLVKKKGGSIEATDLQQLVHELERRGGWWDSSYQYEQWDKAFKTPSGRFEFYSQTMAKRLADVLGNASQLSNYLEAAGVSVPAELLCLPHWEPPRYAGGPDQYPFVFLVYRSIDYAEGGARHLPILRELPEAGHGGGWSDPLEIHPDDAARLGIRDGQWVWVESPLGRTRMTAKLLEEVHPGTVGHHLGHGPWPPPPEPAGSTYGLVKNLAAPLVGIMALHGTRVRIRKES